MCVRENSTTTATMALSYDEGMSVLRAMFPDWDAQVLAELLEANEGHLENTIDMVLTMEPPQSSAASAATPSSASAHARSDSDSDYPVAVASPAPSYRKTPPPSPQRKASSSARGSQRMSRVTLPEDFLRLPADPSYGHHELSEQEQRDAVLAEMLQNEIFRQELLASEEFATHFHSDGPRAMHDRPSLQTRTSTTAYPEKSASEIASETFNAMSVKFASMSEVMKKKASEMYMRFQTRADAPAEKDPYRCALPLTDVAAQCH